MARAFGEIAERLRRSTVEVRLPGANAGGSGVIASPDGRIVTNAHVARDAGATVRLWDGRELPATLMARDARRDLATLQVETASGLARRRLRRFERPARGRTGDGHRQPAGLHRRADHRRGACARQPGRIRPPKLGAGGCAPRARQLRRSAGRRTRSRDRYQHHDRSRAGRGRSRQCGDGLPAPRRIRLFAGRDGATGASGRPALRPAGAQGRAAQSGGPSAPVDRRCADRRRRTAVSLGGRSAPEGALDAASGVMHLQFLRGDRVATREVAIRLAHPVAEAA